jgi:hypothetical protein
MHNIHIMQRLKPMDQLNEYPPDLPLLHVLSLSLMVVYTLQQVAVVRVLHYNAQALRVLIKKCFFVP